MLQLPAAASSNGTQLQTTFTIAEPGGRQRRAGSFPAAVDPNATAFAIGAGTGELTVSGPLDFEVKPAYLVTVRVTAPGDAATRALDRTVDLLVNIVAVPCPAGAWSPTGTHPCLAHIVCAPTQVWDSRAAWDWYLVGLPERSVQT